MFKYFVGKDFKVSFSKRFLNFCFDQNSGWIYSNERDVFHKLGFKDLAEKLEEVDFEQKLPEIQIIENKVIENRVIENKSDVSEELLNEINNKYEEQDKHLKIVLESFEETLKKTNKLENSLKAIVEVQQEVSDLNEEKNDEYDLKLQTQQQIIETLKTSVGILNKKFKNLTEEIEDSKRRFDALLELFTEKMSTTKNIVNPLKSNTTLREIWTMIEDKNMAAMVSIMFMVKKMLEEKGVRL